MSEPEASDAILARVEDWLRRYRECFLELDASALAALFRDDGVLVSAPFGEPHVGRAQIESWYGEAFQLISIHVIEFAAPLVEGRRAAVEWWCTLAIEGKETTEPGALHFELDEDGLCLHARLYPVMKEGLTDRPAGWPGEIERVSA